MCEWVLLYAFIWTMVFAWHARFVRWRTTFNKGMLVVGGVGGGKTTHPVTQSPTNQHSPTCTPQPTHHARSLNCDSDPHNNGEATHPVTTHLPTNNPYPPTNTHPATIQGFCADTHRLTVKATLKPMMEHKK